MKNLLITLCARGGSKGIPGKNIRPLNGRPLIAYTIETALRFARERGGADLALSTDSEQIRETAARYGLHTDYLRPERLAGDEIGKIETIRDLLDHSEKSNGRRYDYLLDLDITSPLRTTDDLREAFRLLEEDPQALNIFSVSHARRNPYFNMVERKENGYYSQVKPLDGEFKTRQSAPLVYDMNASFYLYRREFFELGCRGAVTDRSLVYRMPHLCFDLDHPADFDFLEYLLVNRKLDFEL